MAQANNKPRASVNLKALVPGYWVALTLQEGAAPLRCYVGRVQAVDEHGVRITLIDWLTGTATDWDFFASWSVITSALVATPEHHLEDFGKSASKWQKRCDEIGKPQVDLSEPGEETRPVKPVIKTLAELMKEPDEE